jgi:hypothetical protein
LEDGRWKLEDGRPETGVGRSWETEDRSWKMEVRSWKAGSWKGSSPIRPLAPKGGQQNFVMDYELSVQGRKGWWIADF